MSEHKSPTPTPVALGSSKINASHHQRLAYVYIRQSTTQQVEHHKGSQINQYRLVDRAKQLGWAASDIIVIDDDLGKSGREATHRDGFNRLLSEVSLGRVGIILSYEVSRLARNNSDWYRLLDLAAVFGTVIADSDGIYDAHLYNDRLLLGLKGAMSEAESHLLRLRLEAGKLSLVKSGQFRVGLPTGLVYLEDGTVAKDPDLQVQHTLDLVFAKFAELTSMHRLLRYLREQRVMLPRRRYGGLHVSGELIWKLPSISATRHFLRNPAYAGAFAYGRTRSDPRGQKTDQRYVPRVDKPQEEWTHLQLDAYPAYISWEQFQSNQLQLRQNYTKSWQANMTQCAAGVPRRGHALLQGMVACGYCGSRMSTSYDDKGTYAGIYACESERRCGGKRCQSLSAEQVDAAVVAAFFEAIQPSELNVLQEILQTQQVDQDRLTQHWQDRLRRAQYQVQLAQRQYDAVDPNNRLVAATLEHRWEEQLASLRVLERDFGQYQRDQTVTQTAVTQFTAELRQSFIQFSQALPGLWQSNRLDPSGKKALLRSLITQVVLTRNPSDQVQIRIIWASGHYSEKSAWVPVEKTEQLPNLEVLVGRIRTLAGLGLSNTEIATQLTEEGFHSARSRQVSAVFVARLRQQYAITRPQWDHIYSDKLDGCWTCRGLAKHLNMRTTDIVYRIRVGIIPSEWVSRDPISNVYLIQDAPDLLDRIDQTRRIISTSQKGVV